MRRKIYIVAKTFAACREEWFQKKANRYVLCPFYHTVSDTPLPHVSPIYRHRTAAEFRADLEWLVARYQPIHWYEIDTYERAQKPAFCLTFDDGFKEFYTVVAPILEEMGIPCVCFLNSAFVNNRDMMFRNKEALTKQGIDWQTYLRDEQPYLTTPQILDLQARGFEFGSHSIDHPHFEALSLDEQLTQTIDSNRALKAIIPLPHRLFSFPFGQENTDPTAIKVHIGTHEAVFGTKNLRPAPVNMYNRIWMEGTRMPARDIIHGEYIREIVHQRFHD